MKFPRWDEVPSVVWVDTYMGPTVQSYTTLPIFALRLKGVAPRTFSTVARVAELADARDLGSRG